VNLEITDVQRLTIKPGDRLIVRTPAKLDAATAARLLEVVRVRLDIPDDVRVVILDGGMSVEVAEGP
jgi:multidrug efflux pump subunit AcrA (membrane-fusion protein)